MIGEKHCSSRACTALRTIAMVLFSLVSLNTAIAQQPTALKTPGRLTPQAVQNGTAKLSSRFNASQTLRVVIGLKPPHLEEEEQFLADIHDKNSPEFHHYLTAEEWNERFGPAVVDEQQVVDWAQSQGLSIAQRYPNRLIIDVEAPASSIEKAFGVTMNNYQLGNASFFSNDRDPVLPQNIAGIVESIGGLNSLNVLHPANKNAVEPAFQMYASGPVSAMGQSGAQNSTQKPPASATHLNGVSPNITGGAYDPSDMFSSQAYDTNALYNQGHCCNPLGNSGSTPVETSIAIATAGTQDGNDFTGFHNQYPYLAYHWQQFYIDGTPSCCDGEGTMDMEWATAMSNSFGSYVDTSMVYLYDGVNNSFATFNDVYNSILTGNKARIFSTSWGCAEVACFDSTDMNTAHNIFNQMVGQGWTLVAASGDQGASGGCSNADRVQFPASDPDIVGAGGTTLSLFSGPIFSSEVAWSGGPDGCGSNDGGSTGGRSAVYATPSYQSALGLSSRGVPDIALNADWYHTPQNMYFGGALQGNGGTSIVAPEMAGFFAQENAYLLYLSSVTGGKCNSHTCAPMGNPNYYMYYFGENPSYAPHYPFYDTLSGCNNNDITAAYGLGYFCAGTGYDMVTGWGSANMLQLAWAINTYMAGDFGPPKATFSGPTTGAWYNSNQTVSWSLTDTTSDGLPATGVAGYSAKWDSDPGDVFSEPTPGSGNSFYSGPQVPNGTSGSLGLSSAGQGCHTVNLRAWDNTGVASADQKYGSVCYDTIAPSTGLSQSPAPNGAGWDKSTVQVTLAGSDPGSGTTGSGIATTYYAVDNSACSSSNTGACSVYSGPFSISSQAAHTVYYFSKDKAGNFESQKGASVRIDETAPKTNITLSGTLSGSVYTTPVNVSLAATDSLSGIASTLYQVDGGALTTYTGPFSIAAAGPHSVIFHSTDKAGNGEAGQKVTLAVKASTSTSIGGSPNPAHKGQWITITATVLRNNPFTGVATGEVVFKDGSTVLGYGNINNSTHTASTSTSTLAVGTHNITAYYVGGTYFAPSTSTVLKQVVNP